MISVVLCANKALLDATPSLSDHLRPVITPGLTAIVLLQNGVGAEAPLHSSFPDTTIISAVVWTGGKTLPEENGVAGVEQFNREGLTIGVDYRGNGNRAEEDAKLEKLVNWLSVGKGDCTVVQDIQSERWIKVIWYVRRKLTTRANIDRNCCWNSLTTVTRLRTNRFFESSSEALPLCYTLMSEVEAVAKAKGLNIPEGTVDRLIKECTDVKAGLPSSMMFDNFAGRPMEVEVRGYCLPAGMKALNHIGHPGHSGQGGTAVGCPSADPFDVSLLQWPSGCSADGAFDSLYTIVKALDYGNARPDLCKV
jgi:ketopantoate reductase